MVLTFIEHRYLNDPIPNPNIDLKVALDGISIISQNMNSTNISEALTLTW